MSKPTHYPLTHAEFLQLNAQLKDGELRTYLYLMTLNPFLDSVMEIDTAQIAEQLGITRRTIQRAVKRLSELQLIEIEITKFKFKKAVHGASSRLGVGDTKIANNDTRIANNDTRIANNDTRIANNDTRIANAPVKPLPGKNSSSPHTIHTNSDLHTLSKSERENFLKFGLEKAAELPNPPTLPERWIWVNFDELYQQFKAEVGEAIAPSQDWANHPYREEWIAEIREGRPQFIVLGGPEEERETRRQFAEWALANNLVWGAKS